MRGWGGQECEACVGKTIIMWPWPPYAVRGNEHGHKASITLASCDSTQPLASYPGSSPCRKTAGEEPGYKAT